MLDSDKAATLAILTFWVGPFLLGVEADQIAQLPRPSEQMYPNHNIGVLTDLMMLDLRTACGLPSAPNEEKRPLLLVDRAGEKVGYKVDRLGDLITVDMTRHIWPLPPLLEVQKRWRQLWGVCRWKDELVLLVDLKYKP